MAAIVHSQMLKLYAGPRSISGSFGASPSQAVVTAYLSQPSCVLSANAEGVVEDYAPASTTIVVEVSGRTDTGNWTLSTAKSPSVGTVSVVGATISVSGMTDDAGWVDITASKAGYESVTRRFTLAKVRQKGGVRVATTLPANPSEVGGELAIFLDVADPALRGMYGWSGTAWVKTGELLNGSVTADKLAADAIQATKFADGIEPVSIVSLLPNVVGYTGPQLVFLTTDNKIYRYTGSSWVKELPAEDLTGQLVADQLASNSVTTGKIQAGAVTTDQLAAKAVTASKLVLTDTSNIYPDYDILDSSFYSGAAFTRVASTSLSRGAYALRIAANAAESRVESQWFQVEPSAEYFVELSAYQSISGTTGAAAAYIEFGSFSGGETTPTVTRSELVLRRVSTTSSARADAAVTTASNERKARLVFIREAGGTGVAEFGGPVIRRRNNAKLIVDGSIVATKIATDAVQTHHLLAGAVTAEKLMVNKLSAITADMGDVTAGTFTLSSTGYIRGGATNFSTGAGFWMGYDAGTYKLRAGTPGSSGFEWTGSAFNVRGPDGSITISSGVVDWAKINGTGKPEDGATAGASLTQPFSNWNIGSQTLATVSDGKVGRQVLRLGTLVSYPSAQGYTPIDPTKKYRVRFWARPSSTCDGLLYFSLRQAINETGTWGPLNGGREPYKPSGQSRAAHNATYGTDAWGEYSYIWDAADWQAGVKFFRPEFLNNYNGTAGYWEVQGLVVEEATDVEVAKNAASAAQTAANTANAALADIAADNKLTPVEKKSSMNEWGIINRERASIQAQAGALGISAELGDYNYTYAVLNDYITPLLSDLQSTSVIDGATFRDKWSYFYEYRQRLINKMAAVAATKADWSNVTGSGRPENGATVGADSSNLRAGPGVNMVFNGDYTDGLAGTTVGWRSAGNQHTLSRNLSGYIVQGEGTAVIHQPGSNGTAVFDANIWNGQEGQHFAVTPGQRYEVYAYLNTHRCVGRALVLFLDAAGNQITDALGSEVGYAGSINTISDMRLSHGFMVAPWNAAKAFVIVRGYNIDSYDPYVFFSRVYFGMAHAGQTEASPWSPGRGISQITPSNVSTYIANAAIGNAQVGGNMWSTNWSGWGGSGWLLDRSGNFYGNNIYARGDIEASSLKANTAMVNTLHLHGNAVTVPLSGESTTASELYLPWDDFGGGRVQVILEFSATAGLSAGHTLFCEVIRDGTIIKTYSLTHEGSATSRTLSGIGLVLDAPGAGAHQYWVRFRKSDPGYSNLLPNYIRIICLGVKR